MNCETCRFWERTSERKPSTPKGEGLCRRMPPPHPTTRGDAWCGEYRASENKPEKSQADEKPAPLFKPKVAKKRRAKKPRD